MKPIINLDGVLAQYDKHIGALTRELMIAKAQVEKLTATIAEQRLAEAEQETTEEN